MEKGLVFSLWSFFYSAFLQGNLQTYNYILKCMKAYFQSSSPAVVVNLVNLRMLLLYSHMYVGQCGHAPRMTFGLDSGLCHVRSVAGARNRSDQTGQELGPAGASPCFLGLLPHPLSSCRPLLLLSSQLILSIPRPLNQWGMTVGTRVRASQRRRGGVLSALSLHADTVRGGVTLSSTIVSGSSLAQEV